MHTVRLDRTHTGSILDIGGGGEGIIGRLYGRQVTAIDNRREELDEAPEGFEKVLMDACRCLRPGGTLEIWDAAFERAEPFVTELAVYVAGDRIDVSYGVWEEGASQNLLRFQEMAGGLSLSEEVCEEAKGHFYLRWRKNTA